MIIKTKSFKLTPEEYLKICYKRFLKRSRFLLVFLIFLFIFGIAKGAAFLILLLPIVLFSTFISYKNYAHSRKNKIFYQERRMELDGNFLQVSFEDGSEDRLNLNNIINFQKGKNIYILDISLGHFIYVPFDCFKSPDDKKAFESIVLKKIELNADLENK